MALVYYDEYREQREEYAAREALIDALDFYELHKGAAARRVLLNQLIGEKKVLDLGKDEIGAALEAVKAINKERADKQSAAKAAR